MTSMRRTSATLPPRASEEFAALKCRSPLSHPTESNSTSCHPSIAMSHLAPSKPGDLFPGEGLERSEAVATVARHCRTRTDGKYRKILRNREARIVRRLRRKQWCSQVKPMMSGGNIHYEMSGKAEAITCGGIGFLAFIIGLRPPFSK